jgi:hypothetical protein
VRANTSLHLQQQLLQQVKAVCQAVLGAALCIMLCLPMSRTCSRGYSALQLWASQGRGGGAATWEQRGKLECS